MHITLTSSNNSFTLEDCVTSNRTWWLGRHQQCKTRCNNHWSLPYDQLAGHGSWCHLHSSAAEWSLNILCARSAGSIHLCTAVYIRTTERLRAATHMHSVDWNQLRWYNRHWTYCKFVTVLLWIFPCFIPRSSAMILSSPTWTQPLHSLQSDLFFLPAGLPGRGQSSKAVLTSSQLCSLAYEFTPCIRVSCRRK